MKPYSFSGSGVVIISSVYKTGTANPKINWQYKGGGTLNRASKLGSSGQFASMPTGFTMTDKENVIITETYYRYKPIINGAVSEGDIYRSSYFRPRLGALTSLSP